MGISCMNSCLINASAVAPNPSPDNWVLISKHYAKNGYVLKVKYYGCTNFEGVKILVYRGAFIDRKYLDPHFSIDEDSPIARFKPTAEGLQMALELANSF